MKKTYRLSGEQFEKMLNEAVRESIRNILKEDVFDDMYGELGDDDDELEGTHAGDLLSKMERENGDIEKDLRSKGDDEAIISQSTDEEPDDEDDGIEGVKDVDGDESESDDELFNDAYDAIDTSDGNVSFEEWFGGLEDVDMNTAKTAFEKAKEEYSKGDSYETDTATDFTRRELTRHSDPEPEHQAGNVIDYDGVEIVDDGTQYIMVANASNPEITIKGSSLNAVKNVYNDLWKDVAAMEEKARRMGETIWHGAMMNARDYDEYVRAAGMHEENLPIVIDLDKGKGMKPVDSTASFEQTEDGVPSWLAPYRHWNGQYLMTPYQASRLTPEQQEEWKKLKSQNPERFGTFEQYPSEIKAARRKK